MSIERMDGGPRLLIECADDLAVAFFSNDASSTGSDSFDAHAGAGTPDRVTDNDITVINQTMRARSPHDQWNKFTRHDEPLTWLAALDPSWDLFDLSAAEWVRVRPAIEQALREVIGPYRNLAVATKVLHLKRPGIFPVLDSLVVDQIGGGSHPAIEMVSHLRDQGIANRAALDAIRERLAATIVDDQPIRRSPVRILDGLLWTSHPRTSLAAKHLIGWERVMRPGGPSR
ncbi:MAG: DUF6308 family protein [Candidatus Limnocylindrales bacterium]